MSCCELLFCWAFVLFTVCSKNLFKCTRNYTQHHCKSSYLLVLTNQSPCFCECRSRRPAEADRRHPAAGAGGLQRNVRGADLSSGWHGGHSKPLHTAAGRLTCWVLFLVCLFCFKLKDHLRKPFELRIKSKNDFWMHFPLVCSVQM